jgi:heat shock protein HspQ
MTYICNPRFAPGQLVRHKTRGYRGLVFDVDARFNDTVNWIDEFDAIEILEEMPWYHVLVEGEKHSSYVAEENLVPVSRFETADEFDHPLLPQLFAHRETGELAARHRMN